MKRAALILSVLAMLFAIQVAGCCFGEPEQGQICLIIIPIPGANADNPGSSFSVEQVDCASVR